MVTANQLYDDGVFRLRTLKAIYGNYSKGHFGQFTTAILVGLLAVNFVLRPTFAVSLLIVPVFVLIITGYLVAIHKARIAWSQYERPETVNDDPDDGKSGVFIVGDEQ